MVKTLNICDAAKEKHMEIRPKMQIESPGCSQKQPSNNTIKKRSYISSISYLNFAVCTVSSHYA